MLILVLDLMLSYLNGTIFALRSAEFFLLSHFSSSFFPVSSNVILLFLIFFVGDMIKYCAAYWKSHDLFLNAFSFNELLPVIKSMHPFSARVKSSVGGPR